MGQPLSCDWFVSYGEVHLSSKPYQIDFKGSWEVINWYGKAGPVGHSKGTDWNQDSPPYQLGSRPYVLYEGPWWWSMLHMGNDRAWNEYK